MCDERLLKIRVPDCISRVPKSLEDIAYWKGNNNHIQSESVDHCVYTYIHNIILLGSEMRNWLLFYSLPVLNGVLPNPYLSHYSLLVAGLLLLTSDQISQDDLRNAELYLKEFYVKYPELYGKCIQSMGG